MERNGERQAIATELEARLQLELSAEERVEVLCETANSIAASDPDRAHAHARAALALAEKESYSAGKAQAHHCLCRAHWIKSEQQTALRHGKLALAGFKKLGALKDQARTRLLLSAIHAQQSNSAQGLQEAWLALALAKQAGDQQGIGIAHGCLGNLFRAQRSLKKALAHQLESEAISERIDDLYRLAISRVNIGNIHLELVDRPRALESYELALRSLKELEPGGVPISTVYRSLGRLHKDLGNLQTAKTLTEKSLTLSKRLGNKAGVATSLNTLGDLQLLLGAPKLAGSCHAEAMSIASEISNPVAQWRACLGMTAVAEEEGSLENALSWHKRASHIREQILDKERVEHLDELRAEFEAEREQLDAEFYDLKFVHYEKEVSRREAAERAFVHSHKLESLGLMAGGLAHDFNNMLHCVSNYIELASDMVPKDDPVRELIDLAGSSAEEAAELTDKMLTYAGRRHFEKQVAALDTVVSDCLKLLSSTASSRIKLDTIHAEGPLSIEVESGQVLQLLMNLLLNAIGAGASSLTIETGRKNLRERDVAFWAFTDRALPPGPYAWLSVTDNGSGIAEKALPRIFDPFFTTSPDGKGLGLASVLGIVRGHDGGIRVSSVVGKGTRFEIAFPLTAKPCDTCESQELEPYILDRTGTILVVDDEARVRKIVVQHLESAGHEVLQAEDGDVCLSVFAENANQIDLVLLDMSMPGPDTTTVWNKLHEINPDVHILLTSGYDRERALAELPSDVHFLPKPHTRTALLGLVQRSLLT